MTAQDLKNSILQLAVQGKLVPQDQNDEPASELLKRLCKTRGLKEIPFTEDDIPFDIPEAWTWVRLGTICNYGSCENIESESMPCHYWVLDLEDIEKDTGVVLRKKNSDQVATSSTKHVFRKGNVLYSKLRPYLNKVVIADSDGCCTSEILPLDFGEINPLYAQLYLMSPGFVAYANSCSYGVKMPRLGTNDGINAMFALPPLKEQVRIVERVKELLPRIGEYDATEKHLTALNNEFPDKLRKSILQQAVQGKLTERDPKDEPASELLKRIRAEKARLVAEGKIKKEKPLPPIAEDEIPFDIPETWEWVRFNDLMRSVSTGPFGSMLHKSDYVLAGIPLVNPANIVNSHIVPSAQMMVSPETARRLNSYVLHTGMIVIGRRGEMGRCAIVGKHQDGWLCGTGSFFMEPLSDVYAPYIIKIFASPFAKTYLGGASIGATMSNLNHDILKNIPIPLPPLAEQQRIVARVEELLAVCNSLK